MPPCTGHGFGQNRLDLVQQLAFSTALGKVVPLAALQAGALYQIPDFEIVFILKSFWGHFIVAVTIAVLPALKNRFVS